MNGTLKLIALLVSALAIAACNGGYSTTPGTTGSTGEADLAQSRLPDWVPKRSAISACPQVSARPTCLALIQSTRIGMSPAVAGWAPIDFQTRYKLPSGTNGAGQIVAIVDAYDNPNAASDLATYRSNFGLGTANFTKYNQNGQTSGFPSGNTGWGAEIDSDVEMVSAACPKCTIYLIEANSTSTHDLETAEDTAVKKLSAHIVDNGWICYRSVNCGDPNFANHFNAAGVVYLAAAGNIGYNNNGAPEVLSTVVSVGGTVLSKSGSTYNEVVFNRAGGGCSSNGGSMGITKPTWQHDPSCTWRTDTDVSAVAWNVAEYDSYGYHGWITFGGTSAASALNAAVFGLAGNASTQNAASKFWSVLQRKRRRNLNAILAGNDGSCGGSYLCTAGTNQFKSYSGPAGWGTPKGIGLY